MEYSWKKRTKRRETVGDHIKPATQRNIIQGFGQDFNQPGLGEGTPAYGRGG